MKKINQEHNGFTRRSFIKGAGLAGATAMFGGVAPAVLAQTKAPLKIGALNSYSKVFAALGNANVNGMNIYFNEIGNTIAGRKIEIIKEDDEINPQVGLQKLKKLDQSDNCDIITGIQASNVAMAAVQYLRQSGAFMLCSGAGLVNLAFTGLPYFFRSSVDTYPLHAAMGEWLYDNVAKEMVISASDFAGGRGSLNEFKVGFTGRGGKIIKEIYPPLGNNDFSAYLADIRSIAPPATFSFYAGTDAVRFITQYEQYGLKDTIRLTGSGFMLEADTLPAQGKSALGALNCLHYADTLEHAENQKFVAAYREAHGEYPSVYAEYGYVAAKVIHQAVEAVDGNAGDKDKLREAMRAVKFMAPRGPFAFNQQTQGPVHNIYVREVAEIDGRITNKVIQTVEGVTDPDKMPT
ncbi:ABC transporter substrate-binding protein [Pollutimonas thiosulfatoxidans]|uniref:ABC transporter substrate-binding protein n=1 Tax=Pollutimonas thiosulfatoxidans TaxID=2028345 RepID=A0A410G7Y4_9BURK|nr:ABC transporter substrate-binding protein [Pollutimonas thiosulfatoxidans]MBF6618222.1 ABC transporter substrate-binding protein [Candidimonas sp.]QAA92407.1 ABC transporter substrate-binding protein [Pollutimonas thiosulfatoxidans]